MAEWAARRFWTDVTVREADQGYAIHLDAKPIRTPAGHPLVVPALAFADAVAAEWRAQDEAIDPTRMPMTRAANSALDKVAVERRAVIGLLGEYGGTDLVCYRAERPAELVAREAAAWDPMLDWARERFGATLFVTSGIMPKAQSPGDLARLARPMEEMDHFTLTGFHDLVTLTGSLVLALAVGAARIDPATGWRMSRIDEDWQAETWGIDEEAAADADLKRRAFLDAHRVMTLAGTGAGFPA